MTNRRMHLNLHGNWAGEHWGAWQISNDNRVLFQLDYYTKLAQTAERGLFDAVFYASGLALQESPGRPPTPSLDPVVLCSALAASTQSIGFVVTVSTTFNEPYNVAKTIASLDHLSRGRAAWNVVTTYDERAALNFGMRELPPKSERYARADEFVEVVLKLWDSWDADPLARFGNSIALNKSAVHRLNHVGTYYNVRGPAQTPRSPQEKPLLFQAGASEHGKSFAARIADGIFSVALDLPDAKRYYAEIKERVSRAGRDPDKVHIFPGIYLYLGSTETEAKQILEGQSASGDALLQLAVRLNTSADNLKLDETVPEEVLENALINPISRGHSLSMVEMFRRERLTIREFLMRQPVSGPHRVLVGDPKQVADSLEEWFVERAADGFNIGNLSHEGLNNFVDHVVPLLQKRGLFRHEYQGVSLRENLLGD
jgi:FMN-dependent oxidoreductase (nitrilotriacetate monooxygenase family)